MVSIVIILTILGANNYFLVVFSGTLVPSNFLCTLTFLHTCLPFTSWQTFLTSASACAGRAEKATKIAIPVHAIKLNSLIVLSFIVLEMIDLVPGAYLLLDSLLRTNQMLVLALLAQMMVPQNWLIQMLEVRY